jgi:hypothetical protein
MGLLLQKTYGVKHNMRLERMHRTLKYIYLKGKTVKDSIKQSMLS